MLKRNQQNLLTTLLGHFPIVSILGARQTGKTTLVRLTASDWHYLDMEKPSDYERLTGDPEFFFEQNPTHIIIDEAQKAPVLFEVLRGVIDNDRMQHGRFILTGSSSPQLRNNISESLAGRIASIELSTLKVNEYDEKPLSSFYDLFHSALSANKLSKISQQPTLPLEEVQKIWLRGGYPEPLLRNDHEFYDLWMREYHHAYINRDIAELFPQLNKLAYQRFLTMLCHLSGTILNRSDIARSLAVSEKSIRDYLHIVAGTFLWRQLPSYEKSKIKSVTKLPKGHMRDSGLLHYLLNIDSTENLYNHPIIGRSFEGFVIEEILKGLESSLLSNWQAYYYRTRSGVEIDLILEGKFGTLPIEIKHGSYTKLKQIKNLDDFVRANDLPFGLLINVSKEARWLTKRIFQLPVGYL